MKNKIRTCFLLIFCILLFSNVYALDRSVPIKSASELDYPPYCIVDEDGKADGFAVELLRSALNSQGYEVTFYVDEWNIVKQDLVDGKIQVLPLVGKTPEREEVYDFTEPYLTFFGAIFVRQGDKENIKTIKDLKGKEVVVMKGDNAEEFVRRENVSDKIITTTTYPEAFELLAKGEHDAIVAQQLLGNQIIKESGIENVVQVERRLDEFRQDFCFAVKKGDSELQKLMDDGLIAVKKDGTFEKLQEKWLVQKKEDKNKWSSALIIGSVALLVAIIGAVFLVKRKR